MILFVCVHNAGRSQMAEAFFNHFAKEQGSSERAESAGTLGGGSLNSIAVEAMKEIGINMERATPKALTQEMVKKSTKIVSMGCGVDAEACPAKFLVTEDWGLDDPAGQPIEKVRQIRDQIKHKVLHLLESI